MSEDLAFLIVVWNAAEKAAESVLVTTTFSDMPDDADQYWREKECYAFWQRLALREIFAFRQECPDIEIVSIQRIDVCNHTLPELAAA